MIPSEAPGGGGSDYEWLDETVPGHGEYYYWLEDVDVAGHGTFHGPVSVTVGNNPTAVTSSALASTPAPAWGGPLAPALLGLLVLGVVLNAMRIRKP